MRPLTAVDILTIWDTGQELHPLDRAMLLLAFALPDLPPADLRRLTIGQRNGRLLHLRQLTIGPNLDGLVTCPQCGETLEFNVAVGQLLLPDPAQPVPALRVDDLQVQATLPTSDDLAALRAAPSLAAARTRLIERCVQAVGPSGPVAAADLPETAVTAIADALAAADPLADMRFAFACADCGHEWQALFDVLAFFWAELAAEARRLLREVHQIARAYGWREADILALSSARRHAYLELIGS